MDVSEASTRALAELLEARTGQELSPGRRWRLGTALSGLVREHEIGSVDELMALLGRTRESSLARRVVEALLNNETYFFRDRAVFDQLALRVLPDLAARRVGTRRLSIWSAGCSTGQEALSLAMLFADHPARWEGWTIDILATDVSQSVIEAARAGLYSPFQAQRGLGVAQMLRWFEETPRGWRADERLRRMVRYHVHNLLDPPPAALRFDLVLCRNVLLYFDAPTRARAFARLASALAEDGCLMLGAGETVIGLTDQFAPDPALASIYRPAPARDEAAGRPAARRAASA